MTTSLLDLKGIGEKGLIKLNKIGIKSIEDLLFHLPIRYQDKTKLTNISDLEIGKKYLVQGVVEKANVIFYKKRMFVVCLRQKGWTRSRRQRRRAALMRTLSEISLIGSSHEYATLDFSCPKCCFSKLVGFDAESLHSSIQDIRTHLCPLDFPSGRQSRTHVN